MAAKQGHPPFGVLQDEDRERVDWIQRACKPYRPSSSEVGAAIKSIEKALRTAESTGDVGEQAGCYLCLATSTIPDLKDKRQSPNSKKTLEAYRKTGDVPGEMITLLGMSRCASDKKQKLKYGKQALEAAQKIGSEGGKAQALERIVYTLTSQDKKQEALEFLRRGLDVEKQHNDLSGMVRYLIEMASLYRTIKIPQRAQECCDEAIRTAQAEGRIPDLIAVCDSCQYMRYLPQTGLTLHPKMTDLMQQALKISRTKGDTWSEMMILKRMGMHRFRSEDMKGVVQALEQACELARKIQHFEEEYYFLRVIEGFSTSLGNYKRASQCHERRLVICRSSGWKGKEGESFGSAARLYSSLGQYDKAVKAYKTEIELDNRRGVSTGYYTLHQLAKVYMDMAHYEKAIKLCPGNCCNLKKIPGVLETMGEAYRRPRNYGQGNRLFPRCVVEEEW